ncbi:MAG: ABC transporter permease [Pseudomonadota bacterium]
MSAIAPPRMGAFEQINLAFRFALRELRGGFSGFYVFLACIALGAAAIGSVNAISQAITQGIQSEGRSILGGDLRFELNQRDATQEERAFLDTLGDVAVGANIRSMARLMDQSDQSLVEIKAVDGLYPLYGSFETTPQLDISAYGRPFPIDREDIWPIATQQIMLDRLGLQFGETLRIGNAVYRVDALIDVEPDALSDGIGFAPRVLMSLAGLEASGLNQPGALIEHTYKIRMAPGTSEGDIRAAIERAGEEHPQAGWSSRSRSNAAPALSANIERFAQFLTLVGLTALVTGGVGVANAVRAFLDAKRSVIATFKCLGAPGAFVSLVYFLQILAIAAVGIAVGLVVAAIAPFIAQYFLTGILPLPAEMGIYPAALMIAVIFSILTVFVFALLPLGQARDIPASSLFRDLQLSAVGLPRVSYLVGAGLSAIVLAGLAILFSEDQGIATTFLAGVVFAFVVLRLVSNLIQAGAKRLPTIRGTSLRMAVGNIHRPGALTPSVVLALGLGLTLLVSLALIDGNLRQQIAGNLPERAPNFFFVDIQNSVVDDFATLVDEETADEDKLVRVPMLRGRIVELNGIDVAEAVVPAEARWVLRGDRGITYARNVPENSTLSEGEWWPEDYTGEPLVSFAAEEAGELGLSIGETITVNVLGRNITARIANFRQVEWESLAINFVMVFSPNTFAGAPHSWLATLTMPDASAASERDVLTAVTRNFPAVTSVRVKDAIELVNQVVGQLATAIRVAAAVALVASVLVLAGALAAGNRGRVHDSVVLKTLGATRGTLIRTFVTEYAILGSVTAIFALLAGGVAAWFVVSNIMSLPWTFLPSVAVFTVIGALTCTVGFGLAGTWRVLGQKAAPILRNL